MSGVFVRGMKQHLREQFREQYRTSVRDFYSETGLWQSMARHWCFDLFAKMVAATFMLHSGMSKGNLTMVDHMFLMMFLVALLVHLAAFRRKVNAMRDFWTVYDGLIVCLMFAEQCLCHDEMAAHLRTTQMLMICPGLIKFAMELSPEMMILVKGLCAATRPVFFTLVLLVMTLFLFGVLCEQASQETVVGQTYFQSLAGSMQTLLVHGVLLNHVEEVGNAIYQESLFLAVLFVGFVWSAITLIVIALSATCEVVSAVAAVEKESMVVGHVRNTLGDALSELSGDGKISKDHVGQVLQNPDVCRTLQEAGIDVIGFVDALDHMFSTSDSVSFSEFLELLLQLRGSNSATVKDAFDLRRSVEVRMDRIEKMIQALADR